jgi:hypothetical protein
MQNGIAWFGPQCSSRATAKTAPCGRFQDSSYLCFPNTMTASAIRPLSPQINNSLTKHARCFVSTRVCGVVVYCTCVNVHACTFEDVLCFSCVLAVNAVCVIVWWWCGRPSQSHRWSPELVAARSSCCLAICARRTGESQIRVTSWRLRLQHCSW